MEDFNGDNWKQFFTIGSCPVHGSGYGRAVMHGYMLVRVSDGVPIVKGLYDRDTAVNLAKRLTVKMEKNLEKILLG